MRRVMIEAAQALLAIALMFPSAYGFFYWATGG